MSDLSSIISKVVGGGTPSRAIDSYWNGVIPWASVKDISSSQRYLSGTEEHISPEGLKSSACTLIPAGVPIVATRMAVGAVTIPTIPTGINQDLKGLFLRPNVEPVFVRYLISHLQEKISSVSVGSTVKGINVQDFLKIEIPETPCLDSQKKIVSILTSIDEQIELTEKLIEKKKDIKKGIILDLISSKDHDTPIGDVADILDSLRIPVNDEERQRRGGDVPYYGANGLQGYIDRPLFNEPLILIAEDGGNFEQFVERPIAYRISGPSWVNNHAHILRAKNYNQDYLFYALEHMNILSLISGGTRAKLNQSELKKIKIPSVDAKEQERVANLINLIVGELSKLSALKDKLRSQKRGLMQDLLMGTVRIN